MPTHPRLLVIHKQLLQRKAKKINIALGELTALDETQLRLQWNELVKKTPLAKAELNVRLIRAEHQCMACFQRYHPAQKEPACPYCGSFGAKVLAGEELFLESVEE
jgi:hydrogenase nickel incorporation protein HypA/HybF